MVDPAECLINYLSAHENCKLAVLIIFLLQKCQTPKMFISSQGPYDAVILPGGLKGAQNLAQVGLHGTQKNGFTLCNRKTLGL